MIQRNLFTFQSTLGVELKIMRYLQNSHTNPNKAQTICSAELRGLLEARALVP